MLSAGLISTILGYNRLHQETLESWLSEVTPDNSMWKRCYRAMVHGWEAEDFHTRCDGKGPTVSIVRVQDYVFGGFMDVNWNREYKV